MLFSYLKLVCNVVHTDLDCQYKYNLQLPHDASCNPYIGGVMRIECIAEVPCNASDISIGWFLDCVELTNDSHVGISSQVQYSNLTDIRRIRSRLTISSISDQYAGDYTCNLLGDEEYIPSDIFRLRDAMHYEIFNPLGECDDSGNVFANSEPAPEKCADITENRTIPMSLSCAEPPVTTAHEPPATTTHYTPMSSTPVAYTSTLSASSLTHSTSSPPHILTTSPTITVAFTTTPQKEPPTSLPGDLDSTSRYLAAVCAVLVIIIVTFVSVKMCWRPKPVNEHNLNCELLYIFTASTTACAV